VSEPIRALVLVVDDKYGPRESIAYTLATEFAVETAERAAEALKKIKANQFAAVVMDIRMPEMDGIRAVEALRKIDPLVSVIMLTGYGTLATAQQAEVAIHGSQLGAGVVRAFAFDFARLRESNVAMTDAAAGVLWWSAVVRAWPAALMLAGWEKAAA
jgi:CheY-like chemotaxis protein